MKKKALIALAMIMGATQLNGAPVWWNNMTKRLKTVPGGVARVWHCSTFPQKYNCSKEEEKRANLWILGGSAAVIAAVLSPSIYNVTSFEVQKIKRKAARKLEDKQREKEREAFWTEWEKEEELPEFE